MSRCPNCQHNLSSHELKSGECSACGHTWSSPPPADGPSQSPDSPAPILGEFAGSASLPQAISGVGKHGTGLSSASEPETWDVDANALTHQGTELEQADSRRGPQPLELDADDIIRMSILWGSVDEEIPAGRTIKSIEDDDIEEGAATVDVAELRNAEDLEEAFHADESSKTFSPASPEPEDAGESHIGDTFTSDEYPAVSSADPAPDRQGSQDSVSDTFLSDNFPPVEKIAGSDSAAFEEPQKHETPPDGPGSSGDDQTFIAPDSVSGEHGSQDIAGEEVKTLPISGEGDWLEADDSRTFAASADALRGPKTTEDDRSFIGAKRGDSIDKTLVSHDMSGENYTGSGSGDAGRRTDPLATGELAGGDAAEGTGLVIQHRSLKPQEESDSDRADYQILSLLGEGGMGKVYNARQTSIDRVVAVKMLKSRNSSRKRDQHVKFLAEAVVTGELDHPNIVPIYDVGRDESNALFYSMKNVTGNPWLDTIHQKSAHDNLEILMSVADAVAFAHARGVVHRDLKPENVMLGEFGEVLLMDWGLAMPTDRFRKQRGIVRSSSMGGTPAYMSPEMATGPITKIGPHSDIYLLGAILFEIVTGRPPHRGKNAMKCLMSAARNKIVQTEHTGELIEIAYKAMSTDPKDRYKSVQEFQAAVRTYLAHSESITLAAVAEEDLERAQESDSYEDYAKARFGFEEALKLWDGNKRAKSSLAAARLAYAHCAMGKGDYDLAASLLDQADLSHEKLKVDIAQAREEREARQKRLEAARRAGRVMLATLFLVVTGAAFWINNERANAVEAKQAAIEAKDIAEHAQAKEASLRQAAEDAKKAVEDALAREEKAREQEAEQRRVAEQQRKAAQAQEIIASINAAMAEEQKQIAVNALESEKFAKAEEQRQRLVAERQRKQAEAQRILAGISAIYAEEQALFALDQEAKAKDAAEAAESARKVAVQAKEDEELQRKAAVAARDLADQRRQEAVAQERVASLNAIMADEQKQLAEAARNEAVIAQKKEEEAKLKEQQEAYISKVGLAAAKIEDNSFDAAKVLLENTNPIFRNWEWGYLMHLCEGYVTEFKSNQRLEGAALIGDGKEFVLVGQEGLAEIRSSADPEKIVQTLPLPANLTIYDVAVSANGQWIALATDDDREGFIKIWDRQQEAFVSTNFGPKSISYSSREEYDEKHKTRHMDPVVSVQFSQDGTKLLTASLDASARVWEVATGKQLVRLFGTDSPGHTGIVWDAVFCPNFKKDSDGNLVLKNGRPIPVPETKIVTASEDGTVLVWVDAAGGRWQDASRISPLPAFRAHQSPIYSVDCSPDGQYVVSGGFDHRVMLWRPDDIPQITPRRFYEMKLNGEPVPQTPYRELVGHDGPIRSVAFGTPAEGDTRGLVVLTGSDDNTVKVWNIIRGGSTEKVSPVKTFRGHGGYVRDCVFNPKGTWILSVSHDKTAKRWSLDEDAKSEIYLVNGSPLDGHEDDVDAVGFSFHGENKKIVTASRDNTARIYSFQGENQLKQEHIVTEGHNNLIPAGVYFDGGKQLATAALDNTARVWDVLSGTERLKLEGTGFAGVIAVSPTTPKGQWILTGSDKPDERKLRWDAKLWDGKTGELLAAFEAHSREVTAVAFANALNADGQMQFATADGGGALSLWKWSPGARPIEQKIIRFNGRLAHNDRIVGLRFLPGDERLISASYDKAVSQWNVATGGPVANWELKHQHGGVTGMDLTPDGRWLVTTCFDNVVRLWNVENAQMVRDLRPEGRVFTLLANVAAQLSMKKHPSNTLERAWKLINPGADYGQFTGRGGWGQTVDALTSQIPPQLAEKLNEPPRELAEQLANLFTGVTAGDLLLPTTNSPAISPDGRFIVAANRVDQMVHGWRLPADNANAQPGEFEIKDRQEVWSVAFSPADMRTDLVILGFSDARQFQLADNGGDQVTASPSVTLNAQGEVASASFSPDGQFLVTGARDMAARVWNVEKGRAVLKLQGVHTAPVNAAVWSPKRTPSRAGEQYILTASDDKTAVLWKLIPDGAGGFQGDPEHLAFKGHSAAVTDAAFSPDGKWVVTVSKDETIRLWNASDGTELSKTEPNDGQMLCVAFADDGKRILTGSANNNAVIWNVVATEEAVKLEAILNLQGHSAMITDVAFSPLEDLNKDGKISDNEKYALRAVTASADNTVIVWDTRLPTYREGVPNANQVLTLKRHNRPVKAVQFSPDGRYILTGSEDHRAILWPTKDWMADKLTELQKNPDLSVPENQNLVGRSNQR